MRGEKPVYKRKFKKKYNWDVIIPWFIIIGLCFGFWFLIIYLFICT